MRTITSSCLVVLVLLGAQLHGRAQSEGEPPAHDPRAESERPSLVLEGHVLLPGGEPAVGALVVSSAGGLAEVQEDGSFVLEARLAPRSGDVELTAVANGTAGALRAQRRIEATSPRSRIPAGTLLLSASAGCTPDWLPTFGDLHGVDDTVMAFAVLDDGTGPALYVGGAFTNAGGVAANHVARWDGQTWSSLGSGLDGAVRALEVFDDGKGPALYAGGDFTSAGGAAASRIARWDGQGWSNLGSGVNGAVHALAVFDGGSGPALHAGGAFTFAGGTPASRLARWDGAAWSPLGSGVQGSVVQVRSLVVFDDGTGRALYAGGWFTSAGGVPASMVARWDGSAWSALGTGIGGQMVLSLAVFDDGSGPALYAGGSITGAVGVGAVNNIARWDGTSWSAVGGGFSDTVSALAIFDGGGGLALHAGTYGWSNGPVGMVSRWDGASWAALGSGTNHYLGALAVFDDGSGPALHLGGSFTSADGMAASRVARWDGASWSAVTSGVAGGLSAPASALAVFDDGSGPALYVVGQFTTAGDVVAGGIARWDGTSWSDVGGSIWWYGGVYALAVFDDGSGPALYTAIHWDSGSYNPAIIIRWNGTSWADVGALVTSDHHHQGVVRTLAVFDDGSGPALYAGGTFAHGPGVSANNIIRFDGATWSALGTGLNGTVRALEVFDDGSGPRLHAGGSFGATGNVARWSGASWSALGSGVDSPVYALAVFDEGTGPALYAGGAFASAGGIAASGIARWSGASWSALGSGMGGVVAALAVFDDGAGPALYAGGSFTTAGGVAANRIARWDGSTWSPLGGGLGSGSTPPWVAWPVETLVVFDDGSGEALFAGGSFISSPTGESYLARWGCPQPPLLGVAYCFGDGSGTACPCGNVGALGEGCANSTGQGAVLSAAGSASVAASDLVLSGANLPAGAMGLYFQAESPLNGGAGVVFGDGLRCAGSGGVRLQGVVADASGASSTTLDIVAKGQVTPGDVRAYQLWYRDAGSPCGNGFNLTNGLELTWEP